MDNQNNQGQARFLIAAVLSMVVLFGWSYLYSPTPPPSNNANNANTADAVNANTADPPTPAQTPAVAQQQPLQPVTAAADTVPNRTVTIKSLLYEVTLDSRGAVATSWVILKIKSYKSEYAVFADGSTESEKKPLELISQKATEQREFPFRLMAADGNVTAIANERNYQISAAEDTITLGAGQERAIDFTLVGDGGVEIRKSFVFRADSYIADLVVDVRQNGQPVPDTRLAIGASIGDHAINHHNFYHIESESVA